MFGRKRQHGDLRQQRVSLCVILFGGPALNTQHKSAARPGTCARITAGHTPSEEYVIISRSDECVAVSEDARHSRSTADDGEELPEP